MPPKMNKTKEKKFASNEVSTCSESCCGNLQLCNVCKGCLGGVEKHYSPSVFKKYLHKDRSPGKFQFCNF